MKQAFRVVKALFSRKWWWVTLLVIVMMGVLARLGIWQLDRLEQRRARNAEVIAALEAPPLALGEETLPQDLTTIRDREVVATGRYDFDEQVLLKLQSWQGRAGVHLITPLVLDGDTAVLVDRGWIPDAEAVPENIGAFAEPGTVTVEGYAELTQTLRGGASEPEGPQAEWYRIDIEGIARQMPYELLPIYVLQAPAPDGNSELPFRSEPEIDLTEGPHLGYAIQWFIFSAGLGIGYVLFVNKSLQEAEREQEQVYVQR